MIEVERYEVVGAGDVGAVVDVLVGSMGLRIDRDEDVTRTLLDTAAGAVAAAGAVLEHRLATEGTAALVWSESGRVLDRLDDVPREIPATLDGIDLPRAASLGAAPLVPGDPVRSRIIALSCVDEAEKTTVRVVVDRTLDDEDRPLPILLEVVPLRGYRNEAERLVDELQRTVAIRTSVTGSTDRVRPMVTGSIGPVRTMTAAEGWRAALRDLTEVMSERFPGVLRGDDPEELHGFRVAIRRIRTLLRDGGGVLSPADRTRFRADFLWLGDVTTPTRDADVHVLDHPTFVTALPADRREGLGPLLDVLLAHRAEVHAEMVRDLRSVRRAEFGAAWATWLDDDVRWAPAVAPRAGDPVLDVAVAAARRACRRLVKDGRAVRKSSPPVVLHDLRKDAKRVRYLLECFTPVFDAASVETVTERLRSLQDSLGTFQDAAVQARALQALVDARDDVAPETLIAVGGVIEHLDRVSDRARRRVAGDIGRFDDRKVRRAMERLDRTKGRDER